MAQLPEQLVNNRQRTYLSWFYENLVLAPNRIEPDAVTEYVRTYCHPSVLQGGFEQHHQIVITLRRLCTATRKAARLTVV